jgi:hypothetical protein
MSHLKWSELSDGWQSGRYQIELIAPHLWVLSRRDPPSRIPIEATPAKIETTAGSLSALKVNADEIQRRRRIRGRLRVRLTILLLAVLVLVGSSATSSRWAPLLIIVSSAVIFLAVLGVVDGLTKRSWDAIGDSYQ